MPFPPFRFSNADAWDLDVLCCEELMAFLFIRSIGSLRSSSVGDIYLDLSPFFLSAYLTFSFISLLCYFLFLSLTPQSDNRPYFSILLESLLYKF